MPGADPQVAPEDLVRAGGARDAPVRLIVVVQGGGGADLGGPSAAAGGGVCGGWDWA